MKSNTNFKILYRFLFVVLASIGIYLALTDTSMDSFMGNGTALNFYTLQSNILVVAVEIILLIDAVTRKIKKCEASENEKLVALKYVTTVAITITFLIFWGMLAPFLGIKYVFTPSNIFVHTLTPILMIVDFFVFDKNTKLKKSAINLTIIPPLCYLVFALIRAEVSSTTLTRRLALSVLVYRCGCLWLVWKPKWCRCFVLDWNGTYNNLCNRLCFLQIKEKITHWGQSLTRYFQIKL